jgi:microcystin-dependent protein
VPDTYTQFLALTKPEVGASRDSWGSKWNGNLDTIDELLFQATPIGCVMDFAGPNAPPGFLICDGRLVSRTTYSQLFAAIGVAWGAGDGSTTFALPNLNGRAAIGPGAATDENGNTATFTYTQKLGNFFQHILQSHLPNYTLTTSTVGNHSHTGGTTAAGSHAHTTDAQGSHSHGGGTGSTQPGVNDPGHTHGYLDVWTTGSGSIAGGAGYAAVDVSRTTFAAGTGITVAAHTHGIAADGNHAHNVYAVGDHAHGIYADGSHAHTVPLGGGGAWFDIFQPILVVTKIIYAGQQASVRVLAAAVTTREGRDELAMLREEVAELRALFAPPRQHRLAAPLRGSH